MHSLLTAMPRGPRIAFENGFYHVFNRGINRQKIFYNHKDYEKFLWRLVDLKQKLDYDHSIYAYVLMPNHFHLLLQTRKTPLSTIMTSLLTSYSMYVNKQYERVGTLFQSRFKSKLCDKNSYFLGASRYIHINPLEAGLVTKLEDYPWSSFQELFGDNQFSIIDKEAIDLLIGQTQKEKEAYRQFVLDGIRMVENISKDYSVDRDIQGSPSFYTLAQKKYLRRIKKRKK